MKTYIFTIIAALAIVSCNEEKDTLKSELRTLEKQADQAIKRQKQLEAELAAQKILIERAEIERERALLEQERVAMERLQEAQNTAALDELNARQAELLERERRLSEAQQEIDAKSAELSGLESQLSERELDLAGREPIESLAPIENNFVSSPTSDYTDFYEPLTAYGSWFQTREYGYVFQPSVARDAGWRPYTRGTWSLTNYGWTWVSSEPFGWACYHYGRWVLLRNVGWVWVPGTQWAPAWVTWRESSSHIGWAPLPPETIAWDTSSWDSSVDTRFGIDYSWYTFVSYRHFGNHIHTHCLPVSQNVLICRKTTNITHYVIRNRCVFVGGPRYQYVCHRIGRKLHIHHLHRDHCPDFSRGGLHLNSRFSGDRLLVSAPNMNADWNAALAPRVVSKDLGDVVVARSGELADDVRKKFRDRKVEENEKALHLVSNAGGRESFDAERRQRLERARDQVRLGGPRSTGNRESTVDNKRPLIADKSDQTEDREINLNTRRDRNSPSTPTVADPEVPTITNHDNPTIPLANNGTSDSGSRLSDVESNDGISRSNRLPRGVTPAQPLTNNQPRSNRHTGAPLDLNPPRSSNEPERPTMPNANDSNSNDESANNTRSPRNLDRPRTNNEPERPTMPNANDLNSNNESSNNTRSPRNLDRPRNNNEPERPTMPNANDSNNETSNRTGSPRNLERPSANDEPERPTMPKANDPNVSNESTNNSGLESQRKLDRENKVQEERLSRLRQEQQEQNARQQNEAQNQARKEQEERLKAQEERLRRQEVEQLNARKQQEEAQRRLAEQQQQQEKLKAQQEQQERQRAQEEARLRMQEQQEQQERQRAQQEQARQQQEEARRSAQEEQQRAQREQQEQMERAQRQQQEQMERARQQQEESQRRQQEESQRRQQEESRRQQQEQEERNQREQRRTR